MTDRSAPVAERALRNKGALVSTAMVCTDALTAASGWSRSSARKIEPYTVTSEMPGLLRAAISHDPLHSDER